MRRHGRMFGTLALCRPGSPLHPRHPSTASAARPDVCKDVTDFSGVGGISVRARAGLLRQEPGSRVLDKALALTTRSRGIAALSGLWEPKVGDIGSDLAVSTAVEGTIFARVHNNLGVIGNHGDIEEICLLVRDVCAQLARAAWSGLAHAGLCVPRVTQLRDQGAHHPLASTWLPGCAANPKVQLQQRDAIIWDTLLLVLRIPLLVNVE
mmetsp:Transcript_90342/g.251056  ORF Transcript_90342/g.251056 Transcript_90342/m.251056 type:complete len:209 (-) Transcript_90342:136-762(-)